MKFTIGDLATLKSSALTEIDEAAENKRLEYITPGAGQALVYTEKRRQAERYLANPLNTPIEEIGMVEVDAQENNVSLQQAAEEIIFMAKAWTEAAKQIEIKRGRAKAAVKQATTASEVRQAKDIDWDDHE